MKRTLYRYVALVRALNVGGSSVVKMTALRELFESIGLCDVVTYIQSGNVVFSTAEVDTGLTARRIEKKLAPLTGRNMTVLILTPQGLINAAANNPFHPEEHDADIHCYLMFLSAVPDAGHIAKLMELQGREYHFYVQDKVFYYAYPRLYAGNRRTIDFEKILGVSGTARGWKVINKLIELSGDTDQRPIR